MTRIVDDWIEGYLKFTDNSEPPKSFREWVKTNVGELVVKKPMFEAHGIGVEFLASEDINKYDRSPFLDDNPHLIQEAYRKLVMDFVLGNVNLGQETVSFQEAIGCQKVTDNETVREHSACARAIVANGKYLGAIWRLNKKDHEAKNLTDRYRHNISHGSDVMAVSGEDDKVIGELAEASVRAFEDTNVRIKDRLSDLEIPHLDIYDGNPGVDQDLMRLHSRFYLGIIANAARKYGIDLPDSLDSWLCERGAGATLQSSGFVDKLRKFFKQIKTV